MYKTMTFSIGALFLMTLYGCGSGGGDTTQAAIDPNLTVPVSTAFAQIANSGLNQSFTISGSIDQSTSANPIGRPRILQLNNVARQTSLGRQVALKILPASFAQERFYLY